MSENKLPKPVPTNPVSVDQRARPPGPRLTIRPDVLVAPKPQIAAWADQVNDRILKLDAWAVQLGARYGLASDPYDVTPPNKTATLPLPGTEGAQDDLQHYRGTDSDTLASAPEVRLIPEKAPWWMSLLFAVAQGMTPVEQVTLEQKEGRWGLYYYRGPASFGPSSSTTVRPSTVPLKDAPLAVRERFLLRAEDFFRQYVQMVESRLARVKESVEGGDAALALLESLQLG